MVYHFYLKKMDNNNSQDDTTTREKLSEEQQLTLQRHQEKQDNETNKRDSQISYEYFQNNKNHDDNSLISEQKLIQSPTQAICLSTTVPQNMAAQRLGGKHLPTRNSLRHSRMIVLTRGGKVPMKYLPTIIRYRKLAKALVILTILLGCVLGVVSLMLQLWAPNLRQTDNPYWSALLVVLSGIAGAFFLCFCPKEYPGRRLHWFFYAIKYISITTSILAIVATLVIFTFATLHLINLSNTECTTSNQFNTACICTPKNGTSTLIKSYHYVDLKCVEVDDIFTILMWTSCALNPVLCVLELAYLILHYRRRYTYTYAKVPTSENGNVAKCIDNTT